jgi:hypothetical protein
MYDRLGLDEGEKRWHMSGVESALEDGFLEVAPEGRGIERIGTKVAESPEGRCTRTVDLPVLFQRAPVGAVGLLQ